MTIDLDELTRLEKAATEGPWDAITEFAVVDPADGAWTSRAEDGDAIVALRNAAPELIASARMLAELVALLPKCDRGFKCASPATHIDGRCSPVYGCDAHHREGDQDLPYAPVLRRMK